MSECTSRLARSFNSHRYSESMAGLAEALDVEDEKLRSLVLEHYGSFLNLAGDLKGSLEMFQ